MSAGRVQSIALRLIIDRENEIKNFQPEEYWSIEASFEKGKKVFDAAFYGTTSDKIKLTNEAEVQNILKQIKGEDFEVAKVLKRERKRNAAPSFTTSSLQQEAARKLNFRAKKTMMLAQQLYEGIDLGKKAGGIVGLITYMRTDSTRISETAKKKRMNTFSKIMVKNIQHLLNNKRKNLKRHRMPMKRFVQHQQCVIRIH